MEDLELVLIPPTGVSHFAAEIELARRLVARDPRISVAILVADIPISDPILEGYFKSLNADDSSRISILHLPPLPGAAAAAKEAAGNFLRLLTGLMEAYKPVVKDIVKKRADNRRIAGFILEIFTSTMIDVADELGIPSYFFFPSGAGMLSFLFHLECSLGGQLPATPFVEVPGFQTPLPETAWPAVLKNKIPSAIFLRSTKRFLRSKGILPNTFMDLEPDLIRSLSGNPKFPSIYPIGPIVHLDVSDSSSTSSLELFKWLDVQPPQSVVFLCFGTKGTFGEDQVKEIAAGLERSGHRFLWSLRRRPGSGKGNDYEDFNEALPEGFLERTAGVGRVVGWVPQKKVLTHPAVGAFVSHCGWNSMLESLCVGVPVAAWPIYAEQHLNAYQWVQEDGLATEMRIDYSNDPGPPNVVVEAPEVERGICRVMEEEEGSNVRKRVAEMSIAAKKALSDGGSSHLNLGRFIDDVINNLSS